MRKTKFFGALAAAMLLGATLAGAAGPTQYKLIATIALPGTQGGHGDWVAYDAATDSVWLAQGPDHNVVVIDAKRHRVKKVISGIEDGNGIAFSRGYAFLADGKGNSVVVVDKRSFKQIAVLRSSGKTPDGLYYEGRKDRLWVANDDSNDIVVFKASGKFEQEKSFKLKPDPAKDGPDVGTFVPSTNRIYQPVDNKIDVIDPDAMAVSAVWEPGVKSNCKSIAYDRKSGHLVMGTTDLAVLVLDAMTGKEVARIPVKGKLDEVVVDSVMRRAFAGDKAGLVDVIDLDSNKLVATIASDPEVHTLTVNTRTHEVYVYRDHANKVDVFAPSKG